MNRPNSTRMSTSFLAILSVAALVWGCERSSDSGRVAPSAAASVISNGRVTLQGQVRDDAGAFQEGQLTATDVHGASIAAGRWEDNTGRFSIEIPAKTAFPILLTADTNRSGSKSVTLVAAVISPDLTDHDITPNSTRVAHKAKSLGGYTAQNMMQATLDTVNRPQGDRSVEGFRGDPTKQFGGWH